MTTAAELEAAIRADLDDPGPYLVYADWLQKQNDPRGELIVLQHREATSPAPEVSTAIAAHFAAHPDLLGPFGTFAPPPDPKQRYPRGKQLKLEWRRGFISTIDVAWPMGVGDGTAETAGDELRALLAHPSARFVTRIAIGPTPGDDGMWMAGVDAAMLEACPDTLRDLHWGRSGDWDISSTSTGKLGPILEKHAGSLRRLRIHGGEIDLGEALDFPELRSFVVESGQLTTGELEHIAAARWPKLESLEIWFGQTNYGGNCTTDATRPILARADMPALRHLGLRNCPFADNLVPLLAASPLLAQLQSVDFSMGALSDAGVRALVEHQDAFRHLETLDIDDNAISGEVAALLAAYTPKLEMGEQEPDRADPDTAIDDRWTSVGE